MKKIVLLFSLFLSMFLSSCNHSSDMADQIIGEWEVVNMKESEWWWYYNEDGTQTETFTYEEDFAVTPEHPDWYVMKFTKMYMSIIDSSEAEEMIMNVPFSYTFEDDQLKSTLLSYDHTNTVTVSFEDDDTMILYVDDSGYMDDGDYGGYEHYESWVTYRRLK